MAWSRSAAYTGETVPHQGGFLSGAPCPVGHGGGDGKLCFAREHQQINSSEHHRFPPPSLAGCPPQSSLKGSPFHTAACLPGVLLPAALCLFFAEPSAASSSFQMFPSGSHPAWLLSSEYQGQNTHIGASGLPRDLHGGQNSTFVPSYKAPFSSVRKERHGLVRAQPLLYNLFPDAINNPDESHFKGKGWRQRGGLGTKQDRGVPLPDPTPALCINK